MSTKLPFFLEVNAVIKRRVCVCVDSHEKMYVCIYVLYVCMYDTGVRERHQISKRQKGKGNMNS